MSPVEIDEMYSGWLWRHSRHIEVVAVQTAMLRGMMVETLVSDVLRSFPGYDGSMLPEKGK